MYEVEFGHWNWSMREEVDPQRQQTSRRQSATPINSFPDVFVQQFYSNVVDLIFYYRYTYVVFVSRFTNSALPLKCGSIWLPLNHTFHARWRVALLYMNPYCFCLGEG